MKRAALAIALLAAGVIPLTIGAVLVHDQGNGAGTYRGSRPPAGMLSPDFRLRSYRGPVVRSRDLRGNVVLVTFLDTRCTTQCPIIAGILGEAMRKLPAPVRAKTVAFAISVDPEYDTPESVRRFLRRRNALGTFDFLLGTEKQLRPVWRSFYVLAVSKTANPNVHSADVRVFDPSGMWVSTMHVGVDLTPASLVYDVETALEKGGA